MQQLKQKQKEAEAEKRQMETWNDPKPAVELPKKTPRTPLYTPKNGGILKFTKASSDGKKHRVAFASGGSDNESDSSLAEMELVNI